MNEIIKTVVLYSKDRRHEIEKELDFNSLFILGRKYNFQLLGNDIDDLKKRLIMFEIDSGLFCEIAHYRDYEAEELREQAKKHIQEHFDNFIEENPDCVKNGSRYSITQRLDIATRAWNGDDYNDIISQTIGVYDEIFNENYYKILLYVVAKYFISYEDVERFAKTPLSCGDMKRLYEGLNKEGFYIKYRKYMNK